MFSRYRLVNYVSYLAGYNKTRPECLKFQYPLGRFDDRTSHIGTEYFEPKMKK